MPVTSKTESTTASSVFSAEAGPVPASAAPRWADGANSSASHAPIKGRGFVRFMSGRESGETALWCGPGRFGGSPSADD